jgi:hypothetical protein
MIAVGSKYEGTREMLVEKVGDSENVDLLIVSMEAVNHRCYFCQRKIPEGDRMFELTHYGVSRGRDIDSIFYVDDICMGLARSRKR